MNNRQHVDQLLEQYDEYKKLLEYQQHLSAKLARAKLVGGETDTLTTELTDASARLQALSDSMTFANPIVWMMYKYEAYAHEAQPIRTMRDFRIHCSKPGYICTKRFMFLNQALHERNMTPLSGESSYPDSNSLKRVVASSSLQSLEHDSSFQAEWNSYEFYTFDGKRAKWMNYKEQAL